MWPDYWSALRDFARKRGRGRARSSRSSSFRRLASTDSGSIARCRMKGSKATSWIRPRLRHPVGAGVKAVIRDRGRRFQSGDVDRGGASDRLLQTRGGRGEKILEIDFEAVVNIDAQNQRARPLVGTELDIAGSERSRL